MVSHDRPALAPVGGRGHRDGVETVAERSRLVMGYCLYLNEWCYAGVLTYIYLCVHPQWNVELVFK